MSPQKSILFICTGNVFRSMTAELSLSKYLTDNGISNWTISSAGTIASPEASDPKTLETLQNLGIDGTPHVQKKLTREMLDSHDIVVCMAENHMQHLKTEFGYRRALYFNELATETRTPIADIEEEVLDYATNRAAVEEKIERTVREIHRKIPDLFKRANERFYLFSDFVHGAISHRNGYPFITLDETPNSIAFMSVDIPYKEDGHILVIPKVRHPDVSEVPNTTLQEIFSSIKHIGHALGADHDGYNILLNNGMGAGQYIMHTHFHIIPRRYDDEIKIEVWKKPQLTREEFISMNDKLKSRIKATL